MANICIIGDGGWGTALALVLHRNGHAVRVWGAFPDYIAEICSTHSNTKFLPGVALPPEIRWTADRAEAAAGADATVIAVPSRYFTDVLSSFSPLLRSCPLLVSVTKGIDRRTHQCMTDVAEKVLGIGPATALSGPSIAPEVARGIPTAVVAACRDNEKADAVQSLFSNTALRVYTSDDVTGVELGGALKNVIAIAAGVCDGIGFGDNSKAALITRGLAEMARLGAALGAHPSTFAGLSGMGDLVVTCASRHSRNRMVGERLGRGESMEAILKSMEQVAEGTWTCAAARELAQAHKVEVPITDEVFSIIHEGKSPREAVESLMTREVKAERG
jgi:glycerol-3-phosphate dehydrogenase (NAD(P)+)